MPELPEVETIRLGLVRRIVDKPIERVQVHKEKMVRGVSPAAFVRRLKGKQFSGITRIGKLLILSIKDSDDSLLVHLKMTGQLIYQKNRVLIAGGHQWPPIDDELPNKYSHIIITFRDKSTLYFNDLRQFGYMEIADKERVAAVVDAFGPDPLLPGFQSTVFREAFDGRRISLKSALLNQSIIAGIGNIYADEICFHARVLPTRPVNTITEAEFKRLYRATVHIIGKALTHGGTTFRDYRDADGAKGNFTQLLKVYGRGNLLCRRCKQSEIQKIQHAGRGTHYCSHCQA